MPGSAAPLSIYQLRIVLRGVSPLIWPQMLVHDATTLAHLHTILRILFAWGDEQLHRFSIHGREYGSSGAPTGGVRLRDCCLQRGERCRYMYDFGVYGEGDIRLEALLPLAPRPVYPVCIGSKRAAPSEDCDGAWGYMERLDQHRLYPPRDARQVVADAISTVLQTGPHTLVWEALGNLDDLRETVNCLEGYQAFQPDHLDRGDINRRLHGRAWEGGAAVWQGA